MFVFFFVIISCVCKPWVSKPHPAGAFSFLKIAFLEISNMGIVKNQRFLSSGLYCVMYASVQFFSPSSFCAYFSYTEGGLFERLLR